MIGVDQIRAGSSEVILAGGLESMTNAPYLLLKARQVTGWGTTRYTTTCFWMRC